MKSKLLTVLIPCCLCLGVAGAQSASPKAEASEKIAKPTATSTATKQNQNNSGGSNVQIQQNNSGGNNNIQSQNCPGGKCGNNFITYQWPPPPDKNPRVSFCGQQSTQMDKLDDPPEARHKIFLRLETDTSIRDPWREIEFDGPVLACLASQENAGSHTDYESNMDLRYPKKNACGFRVNSLTSPWDPQHPLLVQVSSVDEVHVTLIRGGYGNSREIKESYVQKQMLPNGTCGEPPEVRGK